VRAQRVPTAQGFILKWALAHWARLHIARRERYRFARLPGRLTGAANTVRRMDGTLSQS
jgi:hypothetical protein